MIQVQVPLTIEIAYINGGYCYAVSFGKQCLWTDGGCNSEAEAEAKARASIEHHLKFQNS